MKKPLVCFAVCLFAGIASLPLVAAPGASKPGVSAGSARNARAAEPPESSCLPPYFGESIPAQKILKDLSEGRAVDLQGRVIDGNLDADLIWPAADDRKTSLRVIAGRLRLESCRINGRISFPRSVFLGDLALTCTEVMGEIDLSDTEIRGALQLERARVQGLIRLVNLSVGMETSLKRAIIEDRVDATGARLHALVLAGGNFRREVDLSRAVVGTVDVSSATLAGAVRLEDVLILSGLAGRETTFNRGLTLNSVRIVAQMDLSGATSPTGLSFSDLSVGGNMVIPVSCDGPVSLGDVSVGKNLVMIDGDFKEFTMTRMRVHGSSELSGVRFAGKVVIQDSDFGERFNATEALFAGDTEFRKVRFPGEDPMAGVLFARAPMLTDTTLPRPPKVKPKDGEEESGDETGEGTLDDDSQDAEP